MRKNILSVLLLALLPLLCPAKELDDRAPGLYAIVDGESVPLTFTYGCVTISGKDLHGVEVTYTTYSYKGETSGTAADSIFHLVLDPKNNKVAKQLKNYNPFVKSMTPGKIRIIPLEVNPETKCREFYLGKKMDVFKMEEKGGIPFESVKISDNSYLIKVNGLVPCEYGFAFTTETGYGTDYEAIFGFTIQ